MRLRAQLRTFEAGDRGRNTIEQLHGALADAMLALARAESIRLNAKRGPKDGFREASRVLLLAAKVAHNTAVDLSNATQRQWGRDAYYTDPGKLAREAFDACSRAKEAVGFLIRSGF